MAHSRPRPPTLPRQLRVSSTDAERKLWSLLRKRQLAGSKFARQFAVGPYVVDFVCREAALVVEVDGGQHNGSLADLVRTQFLTGHGYGVLRFWNNEVLRDPVGVAEAIALTMNGHPSPGWRFTPADLSPEGRGEKGARAAHNSTLGETPIPLPSGERSAAGRVRGGGETAGPA